MVTAKLPGLNVAVGKVKVPIDVYEPPALLLKYAVKEVWLSYRLPLPLELVVVKVTVTVLPEQTGVIATLLTATDCAETEATAKNKIAVSDLVSVEKVIFEAINCNLRLLVTRNYRLILQPQNIIGQQLK